MLDPTINSLFESRDYAAFAKIVGKYRHDLLNRQGNVQLGCNIISRFVARLPDSPFLEADVVQQVGEIANDLVLQCHTTTEGVREVLWFPTEEELLEADEETHARFAEVQSRWEPYDRQAWESLLITLKESIAPQLTTLEERLSQLSEGHHALVADITDDNDVGAMLASITEELDSALEAFQRFKDLMNLQKLTYVSGENRWDSTD